MTAFLAFVQRILKINRQKTPRINEELFSRLPIEIWQLIGSYLPLASITAFTLTCWRAVEMFGNEHWSELLKNQHREDRVEFLQLLDTVLPSHLLCATCNIYHKRSKRESLFRGTYIRSSKNSCEDPLKHGNLYEAGCGYELMSWHQIHLVMRSYRLGSKFGPSMQVLKDTRQFIGSCIVSEGRISNDKLLLRTRFSIPMDPREIVRSPASKPSALELLQPETCQHDLSIWQQVTPDIQSFCASALKTNSEQSIVATPVSLPISACKYCPTEICIEMGHHMAFPKSDVAKVRRRISQPLLLLVVTRWVDVGEGLAKESEEWKALTSTHPRFHTFNRPRGPEIHLRFELTQSGFPNQAKIPALAAYNLFGLNVFGM